MIGSLRQDLRFATRIFSRRPLVTFLIVLTLGLGIGTNTAIFSVVNTVLLKPLPVDHPERVVMIYEKKLETGDDSMVAPATYLDWKERSDVFDSLSPVGYEYYNVTGLGDPIRPLGARVTHEFFDIMDRAPVLGRRLLTSDDEPGAERVVVLRNSFWQRHFGGDPDAIGKTFQLYGNPYRVVGVMPPGYVYPERAQFWLPASFSPDESAIRWRYLFVIAKLKPGVAVSQAQVQMETVSAGISRANPDTNTGWGSSVERLDEELVAGARKSLWILLAAVGFVLLIACANVAGLLLARATARSREMAVRAAIGAGRRRLLRQLLTESLTLAVAGGVLGVVLAYATHDALASLLRASVPRVDEVSIDIRVLLVTLTVSLAAGLVFGLAPALRALRIDLVDSLKESSGQAGSARGSRRVLQVLVVGEVALTVVVLVCSGLLIRSLLELRSIDPGFSVDGLVVVPVSIPGAEPQYHEGYQQIAFFHEARERISRLAGVEDSGLISFPPLAWPATVSRFTLEDRAAPPVGEEPTANIRLVSGDYLSTMKIPLLQGRSIGPPDDAEAAPVAMVNRELAEAFWPGRSAVGQRLGYQDRSLEIVGVVGNVTQRGLTKDITPTLYIPFEQSPMDSMTIVARTSGDAEALVQRAREAVWSLDPELPLELASSMQSRIDDSVARPQARATLLSIFALLALLLSGLGIYGIVSYSAAQRTDEIGLRLALGAGRGQVFGLLLRQGMALVLLGLVLGLVGAAWATRLLSSLLYEVSAGDPLTFVGIALLLALIGLAASLIPALRASRAQPAEALRYE